MYRRSDERERVVSIPDHIIEEIKSRTSISEVAGEFVQLRRSGNSQIGLCPFHSEKTPSFHVREEAGTFHCFGCGKHGNAFTLLIELRGLTFPEAVRTLARRIGLEVPEDSRRDSKRDEEERKKRGLARVVSGLAAEVYKNLLSTRGAPQEYLAGRALKQQTIEAFNVGFAPDSRRFIFDAVEKLIPAADLGGASLREVMETIGLIKKKDDSTDSYDVFRNRIIFPIARSDGAPIAFGGRILPGPDTGRAPKYLNSCEHLLYAKRQTLYGLPQAMRELRVKRQAFVVEGYMDVLGVHQAGIENVVATCGTAVTDQHASLLRRFVERVTIVFDGDAAGEKAAAQCFEAFLNSGLDCFAVSLPDGEDPDTLAQQLSSAGLQDYFESKKRTLFDVYLEHIIREIAGPGADLSPTSTGKIANKLAETISRVKNSVEREFLLRRGAERLGATVSSLELLLNGTRSRDLPQMPRAKNVRAPGEALRNSPGEPPPFEADRPMVRQFQGERRPPATKEPSAPVAPGKTIQGKILKFYHQVLIAVVSSPPLAAEVLRISVFEEPEKNIRMPEKLRRFLQAVDERVRGGSESDWDSPLTAEISEEEMRTLLETHRFPADQVLRESKMQSSLREYSPNDIIQAADGLRDRERGRRELEALRTAQQEAGDSSNVLEIAQKKLEKRRALDRLGRG